MDVSREAARLREILSALSAWPTYPVWAPLVEAELLSAPAKRLPGAQQRLHDRGARASRSRGGRLATRRRGRRVAAGAGAPRPYALLRLAEASAAQGDRAAAQTAATESRAVASSAGFGLIVQSVDRLRERAVLGRQSQTRTADTSLTEREAQVLALIEQGLSNKQIGETLYISAKTASVHVSSILKKVGATSRTEAVYRASRATL